MLIFFSHGYGTAGNSVSYGHSTKSLSPDETSESGLTIEETHLAIKNALDSANEGEKLDAIIMFSCLTNMLGLNYSLKDTTKMIIGSEDIISYATKNIDNTEMDGIKLDALIRKLKHEPNIDKKELAEFIIDSSINPYKKPLNTPERDFYLTGELSGIDTEKMDSFMSYFNKFSDTLKERLENPETKEKTVRTLFKASMESRIYYTMSYHDLYDLLELIEKNSDDSEIKEVTSKLRNFLEEEVIIYEKHQYHRPDNSHGMSVYFPRPIIIDEPYRGYQEYYKKSELARDTSWDEVIELLRKGSKEFNLQNQD